jgi:hypothetical protein
MDTWSTCCPSNKAYVVYLPLVPDFSDTLYFRKCFEKNRCCGNFNHQYNVSPIHLHALLCVGNFTEVVRVCADRL